MVNTIKAIDSLDDESAAEDTPEPQPSDFCPVGRALDLIGARWTLVLVRHLMTRPRRFQALRDLTGIAPRLLSIRLAQLIERGLVEKVPAGNRSLYALTDYGKTLEPIVREVAIWWLRHAMQHSAAFRDTQPASVIEAVTFLLGSDRSRGGDVTYDVRLTIKEGGGWTVLIADSPDGSKANGPRSDVQPKAADSTGNAAGSTVGNSATPAAGNVVPNSPDAGLPQAHGSRDNPT